MKKLFVGAAVALSLMGCKGDAEKKTGDDPAASQPADKAKCAKCDGTDPKAACACKKK